MQWATGLMRGRRASDERATAPAMPRRDVALEAAIAHEAIDVRFQPLIDARTGALVSVEALARAAITPSADALFTRAHAANLAERLSRLIQRKALRSAAVWEGPLKGLGLSINILPGELARGGYDDWLLGEIAAVGIDPRRVAVEITESALLADHAAVGPQLSALRSAGVQIAVDDFGTGYASLAYLSGLPLDAIKIDRSLVRDIVRGERDRIVVKALLRLARELDLHVVVEGVETSAQLALLSEWGARTYQGFLGSPALALDELSRYAAATALQAA